MPAKIPDFSSFLQNKKLPTLPGIALKLLEAFHKSPPDLREVSDIIALDPPLSVEVLRLINSPFYGLPSKISSVFHAAQMLGLTTIKSLCLSFSVIKSFRHQHHDFDYTAYWQDSLRAALACKLIAQEIMPDFAEDAFFLGLIHDVGILTLVECCQKEYQVVLHELRSHGGEYVHAENGALGFNHMQVGQFLTRSWGFSDQIHLPVGYHHCPHQLETASAPIRTITRILHLATLFVDFFNSPNKPLGYSLIAYASQAYQFNTRLDIHQICFKIGEQAQEIFPIFGVKLENQAEYYAILEKSREELAGLSWDLVDQVIHQRRQIEELRRKAITDGLTGLFNYQWFHEKLGEELARARRYRKPLALILADLDGFKAINDTHGHVAGDKTIREVANCLRERLRQSDLIARYGGEEYGIILPETTNEDALSVAERLRESVRNLRLEHNGQAFTVTMSFGVFSLQTGETASEEEMVECVDRALYEAKKTGKDKCCLYRCSASPK